MKKFETLLKSEIKKAEAAANKFSGRTDCKVTSYSSRKSDTEFGNWYDCSCEICYNYEEPADFSVGLFVFMDDRRRSFAQVKTW